MNQAISYLEGLRLKIRLLGFELGPMERSDDGELVAVAFRSEGLPLKANGVTEVEATVHLLKVITRP